jgi:Xaa-Pro aminopeptidase
MIVDRLNKLKSIFTEHEIDGYIIPTTDEYQGEYTAPYAKRLEYIIGFSGSNGIAIILNGKSLLLTDGRYLTQAANTLDPSLFQIIDITKLNHIKWSEYGLDADKMLGFDPKIFTSTQLKLFKELNLKAVNVNLVDQVWNDQPAKPASKAYKYGEEYAGESWKSKIAKIQQKIKEKHAEYCLITASDSICWLLNIRANDVEYLPILHGYLIVGLNKSYLFTNKVRVQEIEQELMEFVEIKPEEEIFNFLSNIQSKILIDETNSSIVFLEFCNEHNKEFENVIDSCVILKACKNPSEIKHVIEGHIKDAAALCEFFAWLEEQVDNGGELNEYLLGEKLIEFRSKQQDFVFPSFSSICGFESNGAIIHYRADKASAKVIKGSGLLLIDSGGQYIGCTTDVTRTIVVGTPSLEQIKRYTQVLKGHLNISTAKFPRGTTGAHLDSLARYALWQEELDYAHGTGHGVGAFLSVHEGPQRISSVSHVALQPGMILSNEPGFYKVGEFGIRIENLVYVTLADSERFLKFQDLTLVPYCSKLIDKNMLSQADKEHIKAYYTEIKNKVMPLLSSSAKQWVENEFKLFE